MPPRQLLHNVIVLHDCVCMCARVCVCVRVRGVCGGASTALPFLSVCAAAVISIPSVNVAMWCTASYTQCFAECTTTSSSV